MTWRRRCVDAEATRRAGAALAPALRAGDVVLLLGPLGAGKTTFTQGLARGLGVTERVTSPTFTMVRTHRCAPGSAVAAVHHADLYRVENEGEIWDLALGELLEEGGVAVVEWGQLAGDLLGAERFEVAITPADDDSREIVVGGPLAAARAAALSGWASR